MCCQELAQHYTGKRNTRSSEGSPALKSERQPAVSNPVRSHSAPIDVTDIKPFIFYLIPPVINDLLGLRALQVITLVVLISSLFTSNRTKLLSTWTYLSLPAVIASIFGNVALWFATFLCECLMAFGTLHTHIITPGVFSCIAAPLILCTHGEFKAFSTSFCWFGIMMAIIQFNFTRHSFDRTSSKYVRWYSWRRAEHATLASVLWLTRGGRKQLEPGDLSTLIGTGSAGLLISIFQLNTRRR